MKAHRSAWTYAFPPVVLHTSVKIRDTHLAYLAAKSGDAAAAYQLSRDLIFEGALRKLAQLIAGRTIAWLPVHAEETKGFNAIPIGFANVLSDHLGGAVVRSLYQANIVSHTRADGFHRIAHQALFAGTLSAGVTYIGVDDHFGMGGTLANLRGFAAHLGCQVIAATTLTASRGNDIIGLSADTLDELQTRYGDDLENIIRKEAGFDLDCLTEPEAQYLIRAKDVDSIRTRLTAAKNRDGARND